MSTLKGVFNNIIYQGLESIGRYYSSYRGYVVDNEDEETLGRIKVKIPSVTLNKEHPTWAYPKNQMGGNGYGTQFLPSIGDIIWVEFEHGDTRFPIWSFAHRSTGETPSEFASAQVYGFKTPKGQMVIIDDRDDVEKIIIKSNNHLVLQGDKVIIDGSEIFIQGIIKGTPRFSVGANGSFASVDGKVVGVTNGIVTNIT